MNFVIFEEHSIFGIQGASARKSECLMPNGDFRGSCTDISVKPYFSIDPNVPATCALSARCLTMFSGLPAVLNKVYIPADVQLENVSNNNGTLVHWGKALNERTANPKVNEKPLDSKNHCLPPQGSYHKTCVTVKEPYISPDPNLSKTDLCKASSECETLIGSRQSNMIYFNIKTQDHHQHVMSIQRVENCDGSLVLGKDDAQCQIADISKIQKIAREQGERTLRI